MAIKVYTSTENKVLSVQLAEEISSIKNVFQRHFIVTGHNTTNDFLTQVIAEENDIAANIEYKRVLEFVEIVYSILNAGLRKKDLFKAHQLVWLIDEVLSDTDFINRDELKKIKEYIGDDTQKRFTLSEKIAGLFHSYQEDTPEIIQAWNKGTAYSRPDFEATDEPWQRIIWQAIAKKLGTQFPDLTKVYSLISKSLQTTEGQQLIKDKLPSVSFYGNLPYSQSLVNLLKEVGKYITISIFYVSFERNNQHRLVQNFGRLAEKQRILLEKFNQINLESNQDHSQNLLGELQKRIKGESDILKEVEVDNSITIANSFTVSREVEALYHYLVKQFEENKDLMMRDICVIIPDVDAYAPAINAYFTNKAFKIDYTLYDTSHKIHASPYSAIESLFRMEKNEFTSKRVMSLLDFDFIRNKFAIGEDLIMLTRAVKLANIRHGIDGSAAIETEYVSWRYGLKRLIYGFCLPPNMEEVEFADASFYPVDEFEENDTVEIMRLNAFVEQLDAWLELRDKERTLNEWIAFISDNTVAQFIDFKEHDANLLTGILSDLDTTSEFYSQKVPYKVMRYFLLNNFGQLEGGERKGYGGVRFVSPNTYLSNPVKIYAFLGMNSKDFPRNTTELSFDLSDDKRITKNEKDKNLLLNILLFAKEKVYFSYLGQDIRNNSTIPASTVLDELTASLNDFVTNFKADKFEVKHPLHAFSKRYNSKEEPGLTLYSPQEKKDTLFLELYDQNAEKSVVDLPLENGKKVIHLHDLIRFMEDPVKHYFNKVLNVYFSDREVELDEVEPFELNNLTGWAVKDKLVRNLLLKGSIDGYTESLKKRGELPLSEFGNQIFEDYKKQAAPIIEDEGLVELVNKYSAKEIKDEIEIGDYLLKGKIEGIFEGTYVFTTPSSNKAKYQIRGMVRFLFAALLNDSIQHLLYITKDGSISLNRKENGEIAAILEQWCELYENGTKDMICYSSAISDKAEKLDKCKDSNYPFKLNKLILDNLEPSPFGGGIYFSEYFKQVAKNDVFLDSLKADSLMETHEKLMLLTNELKS